jgi:hypothetical protein
MGAAAQGRGAEQQNGQGRGKAGRGMSHQEAAFEKRCGKLAIGPVNKPLSMFAHIEAKNARRDFLNGLSPDAIKD